MLSQTSTLGTSKAFEEAIKALGSHVWRGQRLCHYTDLNGFKGILEAKEFWLSDHRFLNDSSEHSYGKKLAIDVIGKAIHNDEGTKFSGLLKDALREITDSTPVFYVGSFSLAEDRLDQWKGYGRTNEGVCLVLENDVVSGREGLLTRLPAIDPLEVIYDPQEQSRRLETVISIFREEFNSRPCDVSNTFSLWQKDLAFLVAYQLIRFKHEEYSSENEIRLVVSSKSPILNHQRPRHRVSNGRLIPYVTTKSQNRSEEARLPLKGVIVGPLATHDAVIRSVEVFLANMGYKDVFVRGSAVPFRG